MKSRHQQWEWLCLLRIAQSASEPPQENNEQRRRPGTRPARRLPITGGCWVAAPRRPAWPESSVGPQGPRLRKTAVSLSRSLQPASPLRSFLPPLLSSPPLSSSSTTLSGRPTPFSPCRALVPVAVDPVCEYRRHDATDKQPWVHHCSPPALDQLPRPPPRLAPPASITTANSASLFSLLKRTKFSSDR